MKPRLLIVDDDKGIRYSLSEALSGLGDVSVAVDGIDALVKLKENAFDLVITDLRMPNLDGMGLLAAIQGMERKPRVVVITAHGSERAAVEAMKAGAQDYFRKPFDVDELTAVVNRAIETTRLLRENERLVSALAMSRTMVFASKPMERLAELVQRVSPRDVTVLVTGESGTGKERVADAIVNASKRTSGPYVRFNCAALTAELAEAELFGHTKGAFTGAARERPGLFREADKGTILLDEIGELDANTQGKLLRVLQEGEIRPVGSDRPVKIDVRVIAATHRDLKERVAVGRFREDLFWRLDVVRLRVPPLRERPEDIPVLARHFVERFARAFGVARVHLSEPMVRRLLDYDWPGNVRELEHAIERLVALSDDGELDLDLLPVRGGVAEPPGFDLRARMQAYERGLLVEALDATRGNKTEAARRLGIGRVTLFEKLRKLGMSTAGEE